MASPKWDIDTYLSPYIPKNPFHHLPYPIAHFLGVRSSKHPRFQKRPHILVVWAWCFIGAFLGVALIEGVYLHLPLLSGHHAPIIVGSFGAAAILEYNTIESPLAQPRNLVFGHFLSAVVGVGITKLFHLLPEHRFEQLRWLAGALSVGTASVLMAMTKTVHPPAGATALLCATSADITELGWWVLALIVLACMLMLVSALLLNNLIRVWPVYWWTPAKLEEAHQKRPWRRRKQQEQQEGKDGKAGEGGRDVEKAAPTNAGTTNENNALPGQKSLSSSDASGESEATQAANKGGQTQTTLSADPSRSRAQLQLKKASEHEIVIRNDHILVPDWFEPNDWEVSVLKILQTRLRERPVEAETSTNDSQGNAASPPAEQQRQHHHLHHQHQHHQPSEGVTSDGDNQLSDGQGRASWYHSVTD